MFWTSVPSRHDKRESGHSSGLTNVEFLECVRSHLFLHQFCRPRRVSDFGDNREGAKPCVLASALHSTLSHVRQWHQRHARIRTFLPRFCSPAVPSFMAPEMCAKLCSCSKLHATLTFKLRGQLRCVRRQVPAPLLLRRSQSKHERLVSGAQRCTVCSGKCLRASSSSTRRLL